MKSFKFLFAAFAAFMAFACTPQEEIDSLTMGSTEINVSYEGEEKTLEFTTNTAWKIESDSDWVTFDVEEGVAGEATVVMTIAANTTYEARTAAVTITAGTLFTEYVINQGFATEFSADMEVNLDFKAQAFEIELTTNLKYDVTLSEGAGSWISSDALTKAAPAKETLVFDVAMNTGEARSAVIYLKAGDAISQTILVKQGPIEPIEMTSVKATYLGKTSFVYDHMNFVYPEFDEYYLTFANETGDKLNLSLVSEMTGEMTLPVGVYSVATTPYQPGSFTIYDGTVKYYTSATVAGGELVAVDGSVSVSVVGGNYKIVADLVDETGLSFSFSFVGEIPTMEDKSFGADVLVEYKGQYDTYFTTKAKKMAVQFYISKKLPGIEPFIRYASVEFYVSGDSDHSVLSEGVYTLASPATSTEVTYANGKLLAEAGMLTSVSLSDDNYGSYSAENATVTVTKNDDGTYDFALDFDNLTGGYWDYTTDPNGTYVEISGFDYNAEFTDVEVGEIPFTGMEVALDVDAEFKMVSFGALQAISYGDQWQTGGNVFVIQSNSINGVYTMALFLHSDSPYEINNSPRKGYSTVPIPTATYTFSSTPEAGVNSILPAKIGATRCTVTNSYTGTVMAVSGGTVKYDGGTLTVDITAKAGDVECKFTGTYSAGAPQAVRDQSTKTLTLE